MASIGGADVIHDKGGHLHHLDLLLQLIFEPIGGFAAHHAGRRPPPRFSRRRPAPASPAARWPAQSAPPPLPAAAAWYPWEPMANTTASKRCSISQSTSAVTPATNSRSYSSPGALHQIFQIPAVVVHVEFDLGHAAGNQPSADAAAFFDQPHPVPSPGGGDGR